MVLFSSHLNSVPLSKENHSPDFCVSHFLAVLYGFSATCASLHTSSVLPVSELHVNGPLCKGSLWSLTFFPRRVIRCIHLWGWLQFVLVHSWITGYESTQHNYLFYFDRHLGSFHLEAVGNTLLWTFLSPVWCCACASPGCVPRRESTLSSAGLSKAHCFQRAEHGNPGPCKLEGYCSFFRWAFKKKLIGSSLYILYQLQISFLTLFSPV